MPACTEEHFHRLTLIKKKKAPQTAAMATVNIEKRIPVQGVSGEQRALQASVRRPQQKRVIKCAQMIEQNPPGGTIHATEVSKRTATSSFQKPRALPACLPADAFHWSVQHSAAVQPVANCIAPPWETNASFIWAAGCCRQK